MMQSGVFAALLTAVAADDNLGCRPFHEIYSGGKELCEVMWNDAFEYTTDESKAYTMWWFDAGNPNDAITTELGLAAAETCELEYFHKAGAPTAEDGNFTECHPWKDSACCYEPTVTTHDQIREAYGTGYEWDRCGKMSQACERFFVQEGCMYECEVNTADFRRCTDDDAEQGRILDEGLATETDCAGNKWQIWKMPIKASYCDSWYDACRNDYFCGAGDYFECSNIPEVTESAGSKKKTTNEIPIPVVALVFILIFISIFLCCAAGCLISKEKKGQPMFSPLKQNDEELTEMT